jgi:hypothetical protein
MEVQEANREPLFGAAEFRDGKTSGHALLTSVRPAFPADSPSWYPQECIAIDHCAPVENVAWVAPIGGGAPQLAISSMRNSAVVTRTFPVLVSRDGRIHVCMRYDPFGTLEVTCLLVPPGIS